MPPTTASSLLDRTSNRSLAASCGSKSKCRPAVPAARSEHVSTVEVTVAAAAEADFHSICTNGRHWTSIRMMGNEGEKSAGN